jgi:type I restriction enzyme S subunit
MTGSAGQRRVPEHFLAGLTIPLPPLPEQRRIAEILDKADALRAKRRAALVQLDTLTQSIFLDMFGDPVRSEGGKVPTVRDAISQGALLEIQDGNHGEKHPKAGDSMRRASHS